MAAPIITQKIAEQILQEKEGSIEVSLDLGKTRTQIIKKKEEVIIQNQEVSLEQLKKVKEKACYMLENNALQKIAFFSKESNLYYKLVPTSDWPTITLSSTPMHRTIHISPKGDTQTKIHEISPVRGNVLDTCCGLGYTAIFAAKNAERVHTFEQDPYVIHVAGLNPYSEELFSSKKITLHQKSVLDEINEFPDQFFDRIIHDPPTFKYAPELYTKEFHAQLYRILKRSGILYHYCPCPQKTKGNLFYPRMIKQLNELGFHHGEYHERSSGIRAVK